MSTQRPENDSNTTRRSDRPLQSSCAQAGARRALRRVLATAVPLALGLTVAPGALWAQRQAPAAFAPHTQAPDTSLPRLPEAASPQALALGLVPSVDTLPRRRPVAIEYSEWYSRRLRVHQVASWAMLPLFVAQYSAGQQLLDKGRREAPSWARDLHGPLAGATGVLFGVNTITGAWNLWDARRDPQARGWRTTHAVLMLLADAGFALTPAFAEDSDEGGVRDDGRLRTHRRVAITSMGVAAASWIMMLPPFRHE